MRGFNFPPFLVCFLQGQGYLPRLGKKPRGREKQLQLWGVPSTQKCEAHGSRQCQSHSPTLIGLESLSLRGLPDIKVDASGGLPEDSQFLDVSKAEGERHGVKWNLPGRDIGEK